MTRKDYKRIAKALADSRPSLHGQHGLNEHAAWTRTVLAVSDALVGTNPAYCKDTFLAAATTETEG